MEIWKFDESHTNMKNPELTSENLDELFGMYLVDSDFCKTE